tara:strand:- start:12 stop:851 length:840 start_codon:yes stop_codon:yes gene_type:complete
MIISVEELKKNINDPNLVIFDCSSDLLDYKVGKNNFDSIHIPRAQYIDPHLELSDKTINTKKKFFGRHPLPRKNDFVEILKTKGVNSDSKIIVYDNCDGIFAARMWWMCKWIGHDLVSFLDGGLKAWLKIGEISNNIEKLNFFGNLKLKDTSMFTVTIDDVHFNILKKNFNLIDSRESERFKGKIETIDPKAGHIPGAINFYFKNNLQDNGLFKNPKQLFHEYKKIIDEKITVIQCGSGISACHNILAMKHAGINNVGLYPGSWSEWCNDPTKPIEKEY